MATGYEIRAIRLTGGEWVEGVGPRGGRTTMPSPRISVKCYLHLLYEYLKRLPG